MTTPEIGEMVSRAIALHRAGRAMLVEREGRFDLAGLLQRQTPMSSVVIVPGGRTQRDF